MTLLALGLVASGCTSGAGPETAELLFEQVGGQEWCGGELSITLDPWVGSCGAEAAMDRVAIAIAIDPGELRQSLTAYDDDELSVLVPKNPDVLPGFQLRSRDLDKLQAAQAELGGVILDGPDDAKAYLDG